MIEETKKKIHFIPFELKRGRVKDTNPAPTMTLTKGALRFSKGLINELSLDGKFVRLSYEPVKKIIGFQVKEKAKDTELKTWKLVKQNKTNGAWTISVNKMLAQFEGRLRKDSYNLMPVKKYVEMDGMMNRGDTYYYVELVDDTVPTYSLIKPQLDHANL